LSHMRWHRVIQFRYIIWHIVGEIIMAEAARGVDTRIMV
jgi:hypothetical protein